MDVSRVGPAQASVDFLTGDIGEVLLKKLDHGVWDAVSASITYDTSDSDRGAFSQTAHSPPSLSTTFTDPYGRSLAKITPTVCTSCCTSTDKSGSRLRERADGRPCTRGEPLPAGDRLVVHGHLREHARDWEREYRGVAKCSSPCGTSCTASSSHSCTSSPSV